MRVAVFALVACVIAQPVVGSSAEISQRPGKRALIGFLDPSPPSSPYLDGFRQGLRELGYVEGVTILLMPQFADGRYDRLPALASELVRREVDVIVAVGGGATAAAKGATQKIPIVMGSSGEPVAAGFVQSIARPGGNITGLTFFSSELSGKRLELFKAVVPKLNRVAVLSNPSHPGERLDWQETQAGAEKLGVKLEYMPVRTPDDFDKVLLRIANSRVDGIFVIPDALTIGSRKKIAQAAANAQLPTMAAWSEYTEAGVLMSYGPNLRDVYRRAASIVDKILHGSSPAELPIEQPTQLELVINLRTAKLLSIAIPSDVLLQAQKVIR